MRVFTPDLSGTFVSRPNRFVVLADTPTGRIRAHCPNPGRMQELLLPGKRLLFESARSPSRKTAFGLVAAEHNGSIVPLHTTRTNKIAETLLIPLLFPNSIRVRAEVTYGNSRFDFAVEEEGGTQLVEVKSCSLCENRIAMFPDAPTQRGVKHLQEMAELVRCGSYRGERILGGTVVFVIGSPSPDAFVPNVHTDPVFAQTLSSVASILNLHACAVGVDAEGYAQLSAASVPIRLEPTELSEKNGGVYLLLLRLNTEHTLATGSLGEITYPAGWYVYAGSGKRNLSSRIQRHLRRKKTIRWHIDYLTIAASKTVPFPIYTDQDLECDLARSVEASGGTRIHRFGSSDCSCDSHLFRFGSDPLSNQDFVDIIFSFRHGKALQSYL
jgi:sugar fermentation stimulation protein A